MPDNYTIGSGLTEQELALASFWVRNRPLLRKLVYGTLIALNVVFWGYVLWTLLDAYAISYPRESRITQIIAQNQLDQSSLVAIAPKPLQPTESLAFPSTEARTDFIARLANPNSIWWATFTYHFEADGASTPDRKGFILPNSQRYLTELGWKGQTVPRTAELKVTNLKWMRVDPRFVGADYEAFAANRLQFAFDQIAYRNDITLNEKNVGQTSFLFKNPSGYGYWATDLTIVLYRADRPVAVTTITQKEVKPGEVRPITYTWVENFTGITKTDVSAVTNVLETDAYLPSTRF